MRDGTNQSSSSPATPVTKPKRKKRLTMSPGMSITTRELQRETESQDEDMKVDEPQPQPLQPGEETPEIAARPSTSTSAPNHKAQASPQTVISTQTIQDKVVPSAWVVVRVPFDIKDRYRHYIATIVKVKPEINVMFLKHAQSTPHTFVYPMIDDSSDIDKEDILKVLPKPILDRKQRMIFDVDVNLWPK
ncbi:hypothetical protein Pcinc_034662 [Petrolisthes cinctipes]|uniref:Uncharacterized protein n=1 Tax=Petrolisthes cinctipes TaxID=88211 RepID=A0AAE1EPR2_PETCI|nr:hypothetical protein Pcinc_034662 [Petrolisthes cinctipes]